MSCNHKSPVRDTGYCPHGGQSRKKQFGSLLSSAQEYFNVTGDSGNS